MLGLEPDLDVTVVSDSVIRNVSQKWHWFY